MEIRREYCAHRHSPSKFRHEECHPHCHGRRYVYVCVCVVCVCSQLGVVHGLQCCVVESGASLLSCRSAAVVCYCT